MKKRQKINRIIHKKQEEYGFRTQHGGGSTEEYFAIRTNFWNDYFDNKKNKEQSEQEQEEQR